MVKTDSGQLCIPKAHLYKQAFSLVELAIVLVILGLLVGGVLAGKSLLRAAATRSIMSDISAIRTSTTTFKSKYNALPGDFADATLFFGKDSANCAGHTGTASTPGTCNGNGDGMIGNGFGVAVEVLREWDHLARANLWPGSWPGVASIAPGQSMAGDNPSVNIPSSKYNYGRAFSNNVPLSYKIMHLTTAQVGFYGNGKSGNYLYLGGRLNPCCGAPFLGGGGIIPTDAYNIDMKLDDGNPGTGLIQTSNGYPASCTDSATEPANYRLAQDETGSGACELYINIGLIN